MTKQRILIIHAHPDDEVLWMGGTLLKYRERFLVDFACLTIPFNKPRLKGFFGLERYFDTGVLMCLGYEDDTAVWREGAPCDFDDIWLECLALEKYDLIFSHNRHGEYYHPHHVYIHDTLKKNRVPFISFGHLGEFDFAVDLSDNDIARKQAIITDLYHSEFSRAIYKFSYWRVSREMFRYEVPNDDPALRREMEMKVRKLMG